MSYNLKKLVDMGFMHHQRCEIDRRSVRVRLTEKGRDVHKVVSELFQRQSEILNKDAMIGGENLHALNDQLGRVERFWSDQIRYIY